jgi:hypothetical protein
MLKRLLAHPDFNATAISLAVMLAAVMLYFHPLLAGKKLTSTDMILITGQQKNVNDYRERTGVDPGWSMSMFSGMPAYTIHMDYQGNMLLHLRRAIHKVLPEPIGLMFIGMVCFFFLLRLFLVQTWLSLGGALAFAFFSYNIIITEAGHGAKLAAFMMCPGVLMSIALAFRGRPFLGTALFAFLLGMELQTGHVQITYYLVWIVLAFGLYELIRIAQEKRLLTHFVLPFGLLVVGAGVALGMNSVNLFPLREYNDFSIRGKSELAVEPSERNPDKKSAGQAKEKKEKKSSGVDRDYAYGWSNGRDEVFTLLIPNLRGGSSNGRLGKGTETYELLVNSGNVSPSDAAKQKWPLYWGTQAFTSGPIYAGAVICFLFILGLILVQSGVKWVLLYTTMLFIFLSMGKNSYSVPETLLLFALPVIFIYTRKYIPNSIPGPLYGFGLMVIGLAAVNFFGADPESSYRFKDLFFDNLPLYNKFRAPASMLGMLTVTMPWLALLGANAVFAKQDEMEDNEKLKAVLYAAGITAAITLFFYLFGSSLLGYDFKTSEDASMRKQMGEQLMNNILSDRSGLLSKDVWRSLLFIALAAGVFAAYLTKRIKQATVAGMLIAFVIFLDLFLVDTRYLWTEDYQRESYADNHQPKEADAWLVENNKGKYFRVFPISRNPFNDGFTPYHLHSIGGYNAAKMKRYQQLIEAQISNFNFGVLNMLNTEYLIHNQQFGDPRLQVVHQSKEGEIVYKNLGNLGPAWIVPNVKVVNTPDEALYGLDSLDTRNVALVEKSQSQFLTPSTSSDSVDYSKENVSVSTFENRKMVYNYSSDKARFVVFSEVYYPKGWTATIDGKPANMIQTNFVLRGLVVPAGKHTITFEYNPELLAKSSDWSRMSSMACLFIMVLGIGFEAYRVNKRKVA